MKKVYTLIAAAALCSGAFAQTQRLILAEEFTQASCGPCASQNPAFNALLDANAGKVISVKYQTSWPGVDPMNAENPTEVKNRVDYYAVNGVPHALLNGVAQKGSSYEGAPANWTQAKIDAAYAVTSPLSMVVEHTLSPNYDSIYVICKIKTTAASLSGSIVAHVAVVEDMISFDKAPGTNGEKEFYSVMRKMLPNANGTTLPSTMNQGDSTVLTFAIKTPSYVRNVGHIAVVGFVQNTSTKEVYQAGYSPAKPLALDAAVKSMTGLPVYQCTNTVTPKIDLKNEGANSITSAKISYSVDNNTPSFYDWTGDLSSGAVAQITLPVITINTPGTRFINAAVTEINGAADNNASNNLKSAPVGIYNTSVSAPFSEDFQSSTFPSANYVIKNVSNDAETWNIGTGVGGYAVGAGESAIKTLLYYSAAGAKDEIILSKLDLSSISGSKAYLSFQYAHAPVTSDTEKDKLEIMSSVDCGATWQSVFLLAGKDVFTAAATNYVYAPKATEWSTYNVDVSALKASPEVLFKFVAISGKGNNMWLDNINVSQTLGVNDTHSAASTNNVVAFPNPAVSSTNLSLILTKSNVVNVDIYNTLGQKVGTQSFSSLALGVNTITVDLSKLNNGMYILTINADGVVSHSNISIEK